jgi:hypothetical protein
MTMANSEAGAAQAANEVLAKRCDAVADAAWQSSRAMSRVCYGTRPAPGSEIAMAEWASPRA